jgi:hypothetical protein
MPSGKYFIAVVILVIVALLIGSTVTYSNIKYAQEGTAQVVGEQLSEFTALRTAGLRPWRRDERATK